MLEVLESVLPHDDFTRKLVEIYQMVDGKGLASQGVHLGINRSDYMLHGEVGGALPPNERAPCWHQPACCSLTHAVVVSLCGGRSSELGDE